MSSEINLVTGSGLKLEKEIKRLRIVKITALISLVIVALISIIVFAITVTLPISSVKKDQEQTLTSISVLHKKLVKYALINDRLNNISQINSTKKDFAKIASVLIDKVPTELSIDNLLVENGTLELSVSGTSLIPINKFINDSVSLSNQGKVIKNLIIEGLNLNVNTGRYTLTVKGDIL